MLKKTVGGKTTTFTFDDANQLVSSTADGVTTRYAYDAAGRLVKEGSKTFAYGYLDKVMSVTEGDRTYTYTYHADGQLASANYGGKTEGFLWDGLALVRRGDEQFINEPHVGGGNPVASSKGTSYFNDALGTTVGAKKDGKYSAAALTAFGENLSVDSPTQNSNFFTGKPYVEGLGHAFLMRNYRAGLAKWQTADPMGYPDGWNQLAYCNNGVTISVDLWGCVNMNLFPSGTIQCRIADLYDESGYFTVAAHGAEIHDAIGNVIAVESLATGIRAKGWNGTDPIKLLSCDSGSSAADYCQELANILGVSVYAADTPVWYIATGHAWYWYVNPFIDEDDPEYITSGAVKPYQRSSTDPTQPDYTRPGRYIEFNPE